MSADNNKPSGRKPYATEPDPTLKNMVGGTLGMGDIFSPENIKSCQAIIDTARDQFFDTALPTLEKIRTIVKNAEGALTKDELEDIFQNVRSMKMHAATLKYPFIVGICEHLEYICTSPQQVSKAKADYSQLVHSLVETLHLSFQQKIVDEGGEIGRGIIESLNMLSKKIAAIKAQQTPGS
jgi:hypothetical protein